MSKPSRKIETMTDDEFVKFLKKSSKNANEAAFTMEKDVEKGFVEIVEFWKNR